MTARPFSHGDTAYLVGSETPVTIQVSIHEAHPRRYRVAVHEDTPTHTRGEQMWVSEHELTRTKPPLPPAVEAALGERPGAFLLTQGKGGRA